MISNKPSSQDGLVRIAYLGPAGTYSETAARAMNPDLANAEYDEKDSLRDVIKAAHLGEVDIGVVPLRTDYEDVLDTLDALHRAVVRRHQMGNIYITGYGEMPIQFYLAGKPGSSLAVIDEIASKKEAINACIDDLVALIPNEDWDYTLTKSTASGAAMVAESQDLGLAALCSADAVAKYGLVQLAQLPAKTTRFINISKRMYRGTQQDESAIMIRLYQDRPGLLHSITGAVLPANMTDIYLRKNKLDPLGVANVFMIRIQANMREASSIMTCLQSELGGKEAMYGIEPTQAPVVDLLGTYPVMKLQ